MGLVLAGITYAFFVLKFVERIPLKLKTDLDWKEFWKPTIIKLAVIAIVTSVYVFYVDVSALFFVPRTHFSLFVVILFVYSFLSVWPQEAIYRTYFFRRYERLFANKSVFLLVNALLFCLAHLFLKNVLVLVLTFVGGLLFGVTYLKFRSTTMVSVEHALYGNWLFTVGMGQMLAFPGMEN